MSALALNAAMDCIADTAAGDALQSVYLNDRREIEFFLWELFRVQDEALGQPPSQDWTQPRVDALLAQARAHATRLATAYQSGDREGARLHDDGSVRLPSAFYPLWKEHLRDWFWFRQQGDAVAVTDRQSKRLPHLVNQVLGEMFVGANPSFMTYAGFTPSACNLLRSRGSERQKQLLLPKLESVAWDACFCATEADAGSDLIAVAFKGYPIEGDVYGVRGHKKFITAGMHDLTENTLYIVIGRMENVGATSLSLSCFLVPRLWPEADGSLSPNHVSCGRVEDKMGLNGCANTHLLFGQGGTTRAFLLGDKPNLALLQLTGLMRKARVGTGHLALAMASSAYLHSVRYARARVQGPKLDESSTPTARRVPIIQHHDVQRMLLEMRARVEGCRALLGRISHHVGCIQKIAFEAEPDRERGERHGRLAMLYGPIAKAYISDEAWQVLTQAIQVHGALGYLKDLPLEQYARDIKILSIWEGTNYIQAQDLLRARLGLARDSKALADFREDIGAFLVQAPEYPELAAEFAAEQAALDALLRCLAIVAREADAGREMVLSQYFTRLLEAFGDVIVGWNLLEAAAVATRRLRTIAADHADQAFYRGKVKTARYFIENVLPRVHAKETVLSHLPQSFVAMASDEFAFTPETATW